VHARIGGRVQGVFFRAEARDRARSLGLAGWVRNNRDGTVEAVFEGPRERVESMVRWCERGPAGARVESVEAEWETPRGEDGFAVE
jgi:acylphosphatase